MDLSRMKAIKRIDVRNKVVVIEPGVTYSELEPALAKEGLRICRPLLPRANKSVIASLLERQPTLIPRFNYSLPEPLRDCGVVWGTGELAFTGEAGLGPLVAGRAVAERGGADGPEGPMATDLMRLLTGAQGSMGIVIWASVKCELMPGVHKYVFVPGEKLEDLIDFCYKLERLPRWATKSCPAQRRATGDDARTAARRCAGTEAGPAAWVVVVGLAGAAYYPQERVEVQEKELRRLAQEFGVKMLSCRAGHHQRRSRGHGGGLLRRALLEAEAQGRLPGHLLPHHAGQDAPVRRDGVLGGGGGAISGCQTSASTSSRSTTGCRSTWSSVCPTTRPNAKEVAKVKEVYTKASEELIAQGAYFSRPYGAWADLVYSRDATATRVLRTVKADRRSQERVESREAVLLGERDKETRDGIRRSSRGRDAVHPLRLLQMDSVRPGEELAVFQGLPQHRVRQVSFLFGRRPIGDGAVVDGRPVHGHREGEGLGLHVHHVRPVRRELQDLPLRHGAAGGHARDARHAGGGRSRTAAAGAGDGGAAQGIQHARPAQGAARRLGRRAEGEGSDQGEGGVSSFTPAAAIPSTASWATWRGRRCKILQKAGVDFGIMGKQESCCGGRAYDMGYRKDFHTRADVNLKAWKKAGVKTVITPCSDCYFTFKRLYTAEAGSTIKVVHMVEFVDQLIKAGQLKFTKPVP